MKNRFALLILPILALTGCNESQAAAFTPYLTKEENMPAVHMMDTDHKTYLMLSLYGYLDLDGAPVKGDVENKFYQNTVIWVAEAGSELPVAKSSVTGATFRGWAFYNEDNDNLYPDYYTAVPAANGLALKAIFDGTSGGGSGGGGGGGSEATTQTWTVTALPSWLPNDDAAVFAWAWGGAAGDGTWYKLTMTKSNDSVTGTFEAPNNITGFNMARCSKGTVSPNWNIHDDSAGRVYNKCGDVAIMAGVTSYASPSWVEYN